jgi:hypothetical protein
MHIPLEDFHAPPWFSCALFLLVAQAGQRAENKKLIPFRK